MSILRENQKKIVERYFTLFKYGKKPSEREWIDEAVELMSQKVNSEEGYRRQIDNANAEPEIEIKIGQGINFFDEVIKRLQGNQVRKLTDVLKSIKRELSEDDYHYVKAGVEAMEKRNDFNRQRVLRKYGIDYSLATRLCKLAE